MCGTTVNPENLPRHLQSVHPKEATGDMVREAKAHEVKVRAPRARAARTLRTLPSWRVPAAVLVIFLVVAGVWWVAAHPPGQYTDTTPVTQMCIGHASFVRHDHASLSITILGSARSIPSDLGTTTPCMRPLHIHPDRPGVIHIESPVPHEFTLGDFFTVWGENGGQPFNQNTIMGQYTDATHEIVMTVNGSPSTAYENYVFPHDTSQNGEPSISISYQTR